MPTREPVILGPFSRGLNLYDDSTSIKDDECVEALNFDPGLDGALRSRPPFADSGTPLTLDTTGAARLLGYFYGPDGAPYLIASDGSSSTWQHDGTSWTLITNTFAATSMAQFDGKAWLVAPVGETDPGGYWEPSGGFVADADMPKGVSIVSYKSRLWVAEGQGGSNPTRMRYSKVLGQASFWASPSIVDVGAGDGQAIVRLVTYFDVMLIFRTQSTWSFQYGTDPATAIQSVLVPGVGLASPFALTVHESYIYFMFDEKAYEFINNRVVQLNIKVPFTATSKDETAHPYSVSVFNNRVLYSYYDYIYVFSLRTRTWTRWTSSTWGSIGQVMSPYTQSAVDQAYALPSRLIPDGAGRLVSLLSITDAVTADQEPMNCVLQTKNYSFDMPGVFKVLFWWGVDAIFRTNVSGQVTPVVYTASTGWAELFSSASWATLLFGTWSHPFLSDPSVTTGVSIQAGGPPRKFVRFLKKLRFRQVFFRVGFSVDGSQDTSPVEVFTISAYMNVKQTVSKQIS